LGMCIELYPPIHWFASLYLCVCRTDMCVIFNQLYQTCLALKRIHM
jgi:hypothetical protein